MADFILPRLNSLLGLVAMVFIAWLLSSDRRRFPVRIVIGGILLQILLALIVLWTPQGKFLFQQANHAVAGFQQFVNEGSSFVFGLSDEASQQVGNNRLFPLSSFAFGVLPTVIVFSSLMSVLYYLGLMQLLVKSVAWIMQRTLGTSGPETLAAAANIFVGHTEAPLVVRPYLEKLTQSELNALMVGGFATVTGSLIAGYASMGVEAGHLVTASVISGPAALLIAKVMLPNRPDAKLDSSLHLDASSANVNLIGAASQGASDGLKLALNIAAMLIAFLALIALADYAFGQMGWWLGFRDAHNAPTLSFRLVLGYAFAPFACLIGIPWQESLDAGRLLGIKMVANEFVAYEQLGQMLQREQPLSQRTRDIMTYALCGFSNFSAIGIQVGGIGSLAPGRRSEIAQLGLRAMIGGTLACLMTACVAGMFM